MVSLVGATDMVHRRKSHRVLEAVLDVGDNDSGILLQCSARTVARTYGVSSSAV